MGLCVQCAYQDKASLCLADDFLNSGAMGGSSGYYLLRSFPQAMVCKCSMEKVGETGKTGGKRSLWPFWPRCTFRLAQEMLLDVGFREVIQGPL